MHDPTIEGLHSLDLAPPAGGVTGPIIEVDTVSERAPEPTLPEIDALSPEHRTRLESVFTTAVEEIAEDRATVDSHVVTGNKARLLRPMTPRKRLDGKIDQIELNIERTHDLLMAALMPHDSVLADPAIPSSEVAERLNRWVDTLCESQAGEVGPMKILTGLGQQLNHARERLFKEQTEVHAQAQGASAVAAAVEAPTAILEVNRTEPQEIAALAVVPELEDNASGGPAVEIPAVEPASEDESTEAQPETEPTPLVGSTETLAERLRRTVQEDPESLGMLTAEEQVAQEAEQQRHQDEAAAERAADVAEMRDALKDLLK